jgi:pimeloyl-ACP methyl ester carboxylesterase
MTDMTILTIGASRLEIAEIPALRADAPALVFLHEGLGSVSMWRDFPARLAARTGARAVIYSRSGYGKSEKLSAKRRTDYMHREALDVLALLLETLAIADPILIGHSDGASIALIHAGGGGRVKALILEAPHVFVEDVTVASIAEAKMAYATTDLRQRLARYHDDVDGAFRGWNDIWLDPDFRAWNIAEFLPRIRCPVLAIQGEDDPYGTLAQLDAVVAGVSGPCTKLVLESCGHSPHRDRPDAVLDAMVGFIAQS